MTKKGLIRWLNVKCNKGNMEFDRYARENGKYIKTGIFT